MKDLLVRLGLAAVARPILGGKGAILVFHRIRPHDPELSFAANHRNSVAPPAFVALLDTLEADGTEIVTLDEALSRRETRRGGRFVCLTFDDGYRDNHDTLLPIIEARRIPVTIYLAPGLIDGTAPLWWYALDRVVARETTLCLPLPEATALEIGEFPAKQRAFDTAARFMLTAPPTAAARLLQVLFERYGADPAGLAAQHMMDWTMVRRLAACALVELGAHTTTHPALATLDIEDARKEMASSRDRLEAETGRQIRHFAFPYGTPATVGPRDMHLAADLGFRTAVTTTPGNLTRHGSPHRWPRHGIGPGDGPAALRLKLAGVSNPLRRD